MISVSEVLALVSFSPEEIRNASTLEAAIDSALVAQFNGAPVKLEFQQQISPKVAYAVARKYESGGSWRVTISTGASLQTSFGFVPLIMPQGRIGIGDLTKLPPVVRIAAPTEKATRRLLVRMPTRSRPDQALRTLAEYREKAGVPIQIEVVIDADDQTMLSARVLQRLVALDCVVTVGKHKSKVEAVNAGRVADWDVLMLASDDMVPVMDGYARVALKAIDNHFPHLDGAVYFDDGYAHERTCTLPIMGRRLYEQFGYVYHPAYKSLFCDNEQTEVLKAMGRLAYVPIKIIEHRHHVTGAPNDALYQRNDALWADDKATYTKRSADLQNLALPHLLSICIASLKSRRPQLDRLVAELWRQILAVADALAAEVVINDDEGTIGEKRQRLLERSRGHYVAFVDDDDWIAHDYVARILEAIAGTRPDCVSLRGMMTTAGEVPEIFEASIKHQEWGFHGGIHERTPGHLNAVRHDLALRVGFPAKNHAEDHDYARGLRPLLKTEASAGNAPLYYYFYDPTKLAKT